MQTPVLSLVTSRLLWERLDCFFFDLLRQRRSWTWSRRYWVKDWAAIGGLMWKVAGFCFGSLAT